MLPCLFSQYVQGRTSDNASTIGQSDQQYQQNDAGKKNQEWDFGGDKGGMEQPNGHQLTPDQGQ